jgi:DNA-directed RNA polymerase beta subunit
MNGTEIEILPDCNIALIKGDEIPKPHIPESFKILILEMQCLCLDVGVYKKDVLTFFY